MRNSWRCSLHLFSNRKPLKTHLPQSTLFLGAWSEHRALMSMSGLQHERRSQPVLQHTCSNVLSQMLRNYLNPAGPGHKGPLLGAAHVYFGWKSG